MDSDDLMRFEEEMMCSHIHTHSCRSIQSECEANFRCGFMFCFQKSIGRCDWMQIDEGLFSIIGDKLVHTFQKYFNMGEKVEAIQSGL